MNPETTDTTKAQTHLSNLSNLSNAINKTREQERLLSTTYNEIQSILTLESWDYEKLSEKYMTYINSAVKAWRSATTTYEEIFREMNQLHATLALGSLGRWRESDSAKMFTIQRTAGMARDAALAFRVGDQDGVGEESVSEEDDDVTIRDDDEVRNGLFSTHHNVTEGSEDYVAKEGKRLPPWRHSGVCSGRIHKPGRITKASDRLNDRGTLVKGRERFADRTISSIVAAVRGGDNHSHNQTTAPVPIEDRMTTTAVSLPPQIEYEDVSAEIEARLRVKEEKRTAAEESEKHLVRKRKHDGMQASAEVEIRDERDKPEKRAKTSRNPLAASPSDENLVQRKHGREVDGSEAEIYRKRRKVIEAV